MSKGIKVSQKHGVNPTIPICFWCGEEKNEIALLGKLKGDVAAPKHLWIPGDYEPCDKCKEHWSKGVAMIEAYTEPILYEDQPPMGNAYPSGRYAVMKNESVETMFSEEDFEKVKKLGFFFCDHDMMERVLEAINK